MHAVSPNFSKTNQGDIQNAGMERRIKALRAHAARVPDNTPCSEKNAQDFYNRIANYTPDQLRIVGFVLADLSHIPLFESLHARAALPWGHDVTLFHLIKQGLPHKIGAPDRGLFFQNCWAFAERHAVQDSWFRSTNGTSNLPLDGWAWLGEQAKQDPRATLSIVHPNILSTVCFSDCPLLRTDDEKYQYGRAVQALYMALHDVKFPSDKEAVSPVSFFQKPLYAMDDTYTALLSGWSFEAVQQSADALITDMRHNLVADAVERFHPFWALPRSAHQILAWHTDIQSLSQNERYEAIAHLQTLTDYATFEREQRHNVARENPTLRRLFFY